VELHNYQNLPLYLDYCQHNKDKVKKRLSPLEIRKYLDTVIEQAKISEPLLRIGLWSLNNGLPKRKMVY